jgi:hypothetical protein
VAGVAVQEEALVIMVEVVVALVVVRVAMARKEEIIKVHVSEVVKEETRVKKEKMVKIGDV